MSGKPADLTHMACMAALVVLYAAFWFGVVVGGCWLIKWIVGR